MKLSIHSDEHFMQLALKEAQMAFDEGEIPVGCVVVVENRVIARAHNQVERLQDCTAHAEMLAITSAQNYFGSKYLQDCHLYVTLEPCVMCAGALFWSQMGKLIVGARDKERGFTRLSPSVLHPRTDLSIGLLEEECGQLVTNFFDGLR